MYGIIFPSFSCRICISRCLQELNSVFERRDSHKVLECPKFILIVDFRLIVMFGKYLILGERLDFCPHTVTAELDQLYDAQESLEEVAQPSQP